MFNFDRNRKPQNTPNIKISNIQTQAQCSTLPTQQNANPRNKVQLLPDHGPLNWLQLYDKQNIKVKIILMKVITILVSIFENKDFKDTFIKDNELKNPEQTDFLIYLHERVFANNTLLKNITTNNNDKASIFETKQSDDIYNPVFEQILKIIDMPTLIRLFSFKPPSSSFLSKHKQATGLKIRPECVLNNYNLKNINLFWICLDKKIYYITPYLMYHPGGESILLKLLTSSRNTVERVDKMKEFQRYHRWVNETDLLSPYTMGYIQ